MEDEGSDKAIQNSFFDDSLKYIKKIAFNALNKQKKRVCQFF